MILLIAILLFSFAALLAIPEEARPSNRYRHLDPAYFERFSDVSARADSATGFDIQHYEINLQINDVTRWIGGNVQAIVLAEENLSQIQYELHNLTVSQVMVNNLPVTFTHTAGIITIPVNANAGDTFITNVFYSGYPQLSPNLYQIGMIFSTNSVFTISDPDAGRYWWPSYDHPWDKATVDLHIRMRSDWKVAANGLRQGIVDHGDGTSTTTWIGYHPMTTYLVCITAGPYVEINQSSQNTDIQSFVLQNQYNNALVDFASLPSIVDYYSSIFGAYPFEKYGQAVVSMSTYGAMEHQTMTTLGNFIITGNNTYELIIAHELAHQWYGNCVSFLDFPDVWLSESFATYAEHLWVDKRDGWNAATAYVNSSYHQYYINWENSAGAQTIYNPTFYNYFTPPSYEKGAAVLHMLRLKMGDVAFFQLLQNWVITYAHGNAITAEFQAMAEQISGLDLQQFFQQWIYSPGIPSLEYSFYTKENPPSLKLIGKSTSPTPTQFYLDIPIRVNQSTTSDSLLIQADPNGFVNIIPYPNVANINSIQADPNNWVILRNKIQSLPQLTECMPSHNSVVLAWSPFINATHYQVFRRDSPTAMWQLVNPDPLSECFYVDNGVQSGSSYSYMIKAMDSEGYLSMPSNIMSATPVSFSFEFDLLVVDETRDGTGTGISPSDEMVDNFYAQMLEPLTYEVWDYNTQGAPDLSVLGSYRMVLWHDDDFSNNNLLDNLQTLGGYLSGNGILLISGWKSASVLNSSWLDRFAGGINLVYDNSAALISAESDNYAQLLPDPNKLTSTWNGMLPMTYTFENVQTELYYANMTAGSNGANKSAAFRHDDIGSLVMFGFPLYFMQAEGVRSMLQELVPELLSGNPVADEILVPLALKLKAYPNPFSDIIKLELNAKSKHSGEIAIYNLKGQKVKTLPLDKAQSSTTWDGRDENGKRSAAGIYLLKVTDNKRTSTKKILKLN